MLTEDVGDFANHSTKIVRLGALDSKRFALQIHIVPTSLIKITLL